MILNKSVSLADQIFERLESDILTGKYPRGSYLTELGLCDDLGVSRTPIREALRKLEQEHIVESTGKGMLVLSITRQDAEVIFAIRKQVEGLATRSCAKNVSEEQLKELKEIVDLQEFYFGKQDAEKLMELDSAFHAKIYQCTDSPVYYDTLMPIHNKIQKYRQIALSAGSRAESSCAEHRRIYEAIAKHDPDEAEIAMYRHTSNAQKNLMNAVAQVEGAK